MRNACIFVDALIVGVHAIFMDKKPNHFYQNAQNLILFAYFFRCTNRLVTYTTINVSSWSKCSFRIADGKKWENSPDSMGQVRHKIILKSYLSILLAQCWYGGTWSGNRFSNLSHKTTTVSYNSNWIKSAEDSSIFFIVQKFQVFSPQGNPPFSFLCQEIQKKLIFQNFEHIIQYPLYQNQPRYLVVAV